MEVLTNVNETCQIGAKLHRDDARPVEWRIFERPLDYEAALTMMDERVAAIAAGAAPEAGPHRFPAAARSPGML